MRENPEWSVTASSLVDDEALVVATLVDGDQLGRFLLVVDEATFRSLAAYDLVEGREYLTAAFELHEGGASRWAPYLVARKRLAERLGAGLDLGWGWIWLDWPRRCRMGLPSGWTADARVSWARWR